MSSRGPDRRAIRWITPAAVVLATALTGYGARDLLPRTTAQATARSPVSVSTASVVRTDVAQRQAVSGTIGYRGSYTVTAPAPGSASQVTADQQATSADQQALSGDEQAASDATAAGGQTVAADEENVSTARSALATDQAKENTDCAVTSSAVTGPDTAACTADETQVRTDQATLTQVRQKLAADQQAVRTASDQAQAKVSADQVKLGGDQAALASLRDTAANQGTTYTWLPQPGQVIRQGQPVYAVSGKPVPLLYGPTAAYRPFYAGMPDGADVGELTHDLITLGYGAGLAQSDHYVQATAAAVDRWQRALGLPATGTIPLGQVVFEPGPLRVTATAVSDGGPVGAGTQVLTGTSLTPSVTVDLTPGGAPVHPGDRVQVTLPDGTTTVPGHVLTVGAVTQAPAQNQSTPQPIIPVTISLDGYHLPSELDQAPVQVTMTEQVDQNVLAVPITALLAQAGGGYAVRTGSGALITVTVGIYDGTTGLVAVSGAGLTAGLTVQVAQG
jgi:Putative peptidoglycan binding domain